ncbi:unnamed protein product [Rotaria sordida]|uniref:Pentapeptide repeat-containing protein n=2 Tax=Rotaria sordida TaxID=392033 RepID=A0A819EZM6_9BILA|nr:unnamed protein product [Rotaria sordida]
MRPRSASDSMQHTKTLKERSKLNENNVVIPFEKWMTYRKPRTKCFLIIQLLKLIAAILVPLMIGAFTVIQTIHDSRNLQLDRDAEYQRRIDDKLNIDIERQHGDIRATELRIQQIYDKFLSETQETLRKSTEDLTEADLIFLRARTLTTIEQVDPKRKVYLIELLYDSRLLYVSEYVGNMNYRSVDLEGVDLSNCEFGRSNRGDTMKMMNRNGIRLSRAFLRNSSFKHVNLTGSTFEHCDLTGTNFTDKELFIINSILPNGSLVTSFEFGINLLRNGDAEEKCNENRLNRTVIPGWERRGVLQWLYNMIGSEIAHDNHGGRCLFFGGERYTSLFHNAIEQVIDVSRFVRLFDSYETKFTARADLGGINDTKDTAYVDIQFKSGTSYISNVQIGKFR